MIQFFVNVRISQFVLFVVFLTGVSLVSSGAGASTFVGNGGSLFEMKRGITERQIENALLAITKQSENEENICVCRRRSNDIGCRKLKDLNKLQKLFCSSAMKELSPKLVRLLRKKEGSRSIEWLWAEGQMSVLEKGGGERKVHAVANRKRNQITIHAEAFSNMNQNARVLLVAHELFHLVPFKGQDLVDKGSIGPFQGKRGQGQLLDVMAAATAERVRKLGLYNEDVAALSRTKKWNRHWLDLYFGTQPLVETADSSLAVSDHSLVGGKYRWYHSERFGLFVSYRGLSGDKNILSNTEATHSGHSTAVGLTTKWSFFEDPESYWGQSYLEAALGVQWTQVDGVLNDKTGGFELTDSSRSVGGLASLNYYLPLRRGLSLFIGGELSYRPLEFKKFGTKYEPLTGGAVLGGSYGF